MKKFLLPLIIVELFSFYCFAYSSRNDSYPKTQEERKRDEMGSIIGDEGLVFRPWKSKEEKVENGSLKQKDTGKTVKKNDDTIFDNGDYLWKASLEALNFVPISSADYKGGIIITNWHDNKSKHLHKSKINIIVKGKTISKDSIEVKVFERKFKNGRWVDNGEDSLLALTLEEKILNIAKILAKNKM